MLLQKKSSATFKGKPLVLQSDKTMKAISKAVQSQYLGTVPKMSHDITLAKVNHEGAQFSELQTFWLATGSEQSSNKTLTFQSAARSTQRSSYDFFEVSEPPLKKTKLSNKKDNCSDGLTIPVECCDRSEVSSLLNILPEF